MKRTSKWLIPAFLAVLAVFGAAVTTGCAGMLDAGGRGPELKVPRLNVSGAAYLERGQGLRVAQAGENYFVNPSAGGSTFGAQSAGQAAIHSRPVGGRLGDTCWELQTTAADSGAGLLLSQAAGSWQLPPVDETHNNYQISFYARLASTDGPADQFNISVSGPGAAAVSPNLALTDEWQLYSLGFTVTGQDFEVRLEPNLGQGAGTAANTSVLIDGITLEAERNLSLPDFHSNQFDKVYAVPPYNGGLPGSAWQGAANASASYRRGGVTSFEDPRDFGIDFDSDSWWFALDCTLGFENGINIFETRSKEFLTIGQPSGSGWGWLQDAAFVFDYHSNDGRLYFHRYPAFGSDASLAMPPFRFGDRLRVVGAWDGRLKQPFLWVVVGDDPTRVLHSQGSSLPDEPRLGPDYQVNLGFSGGWFAGAWQTNSLHRNLVIEKGFPTQQQVDAYLANPDRPLLAGGYFYPLRADLAGSQTSR